VRVLLPDNAQTASPAVETLRAPATCLNAASITRSVTALFRAIPEGKMGGFFSFSAHGFTLEAPGRGAAPACTSSNGSPVARLLGGTTGGAPAGERSNRGELGALIRAIPRNAGAVFPRAHKSRFLVRGIPSGVRWHQRARSPAELPAAPVHGATLEHATGGGVRSTPQITCTRCIYPPSPPLRRPRSPPPLGIP